MLAHPKRCGLRHLVAASAVTGAASVPVELIERMRDELKASTPSPRPMA
jgi:hypothetical protein